MIKTQLRINVSSALPFITGSWHNPDLPKPCRFSTPASRLLFKGRGAFLLSSYNSTILCNQYTIDDSQAISVTLAIGLTTVLLFISMILLWGVRLYLRTDRENFCLPFWSLQQSLSPSSSHISLQTFTVITTPSDQPSTVILMSMALSTSTLTPTPTSSIARLEMLPPGLVIPPEPCTPPPTPSQSQQSLTDDFWADNNIADPDFHCPGILTLMGAAPDAHNRMRLSALSLADLTLHFPAPPPKALLRQDTHRTVVPEVVIQGPTPPIAVSSAKNLLANSAPIARRPSTFTL
jgi:hypothetical protein